MQSTHSNLLNTKRSADTFLHRVMLRIQQFRKIWSWQVKSLFIALPVIGVASFVAFSQSSPPNIPAVAMSADPLYTPAASDKPALVLALSVEFPTVGAQYVSGVASSTEDDTYTNYNSASPDGYLGYYDAESCYSYNTAPTETPVSPLTSNDYKRFDRIGPATALTSVDTTMPTRTSRMCTNGFSGNFLNWVSNSAIDMLRLALTGGDRYIDTTSLTVLQRALLPTDSNGYPGSYGNFWNSTNFPAKKLKKNAGSGVPNFFGAVPSAMVTAAGNNDIWVGNALNKIYFGTSKSNTKTSYNLSSAALNSSDGFFYARVQVCNVNSSGVLQDSRDYGLCNRYPNGNYKPTGTIQKYGDQLRLAAFGYLIDQVDTRYGGVLRAPIKYVGSKTFDANGLDNTPSGGNPKMEWNINTGIFNLNPEGNASVLSSSGVYLSGVISYVNRFGRTGPIPGRYKIYDPLSELHYEAVRYLQGLPPSPSATSAITADMYDGFPVSLTWADPYGDGRSSTGDYSCLKSNIVMIGDKNTNERSGRLPAASVANNIPDINGFSTAVQNFEKKVSTQFTYDPGVFRTPKNPNAANSSVPSGLVSEVMGSAYWAHTHDIRGTTWTNANATIAGTAGTALQRPGLRVKTFMFDVNEFSQSSDTTTRRTSNQLFMAAKYGGFEADPASAAVNYVSGKSTKNTYNTKGNPFYQDDLTTADKYVWEDTDSRANRVGEANTYYLQSDARGVLSAFDDIFARASTAARSIAGGAIQSKNLTQVGDTIYQGTFDTSDWSGDLLAIPVNVSTSNVVSIGSTFTWTAATQLAAMSTPAITRHIVVGNAWSTASPNPVASDFTWAAIEQSLKDSLDKVSPNATADGLGQDRLNYLRGDRSKEGNPFRTRSKLMGDVINSGVIYSGAPSTAISDAGYASFYNTNKNRTPSVFVGANDGMLHAFNGNSGNELFAYIPSWLGQKLSALTSSTYPTNHQSYVDSTPAVAEALVGSNWKTVLISGTGGGGKGVFALDVTDPAAFSASNVMWEFTNADDSDLGNVIGRPQILKLRTNASGSTPIYKWFAVFGSGINNYVRDGIIVSSTGNPALFILDLSKTAGTPWALGTNYYKISLPTSSIVSANHPTGLINFRAALGVDKEVALIYMGDYHGNLWKLDFSAVGNSNWNINDLSYFKQGTSNIPIPMFIAKDVLNNIQPITASPNIAYGPTAGTYYILFGTGKYIEVGDKITTSTQSLYMIYDNDSTSLDSSPTSSATSAISDRLRLKIGTANAVTGLITVPTFILGRAATIVDTDNPRSGWVADLPNPGERQISNGTIFGDKLVVGSLVPSISSSTACAMTGGSGSQYTVDIATGNATSVGSTVGILGEPLVAEISSATVYTTSDSTGRRIKTITSQVFQQGANGVAAGSGGSNTNTLTRTVITGRLTWRQINNYQDLKNNP